MSSEQPDTAALRILAADWAAEPGDVRNALEDAADALDAARAELADFRAEFTVLDEAHSEEMARAEAAEARIAAALAEHCCFPCDCGNPCATYRALTEGTGQ